MSNLLLNGFDMFRAYKDIVPFNKANAKYQPTQSQKIKNKRKKGRKRK